MGPNSNSPLSLFLGGAYIRRGLFVSEYGGFFGLLNFGPTNFGHLISDKTGKNQAFKVKKLCVKGLLRNQKHLKFLVMNVYSGALYSRGAYIRDFNVLYTLYIPSPAIS